MLTFDEVVALVASQPKPLLAAIDGLPLSGKTTLAQQVTEELGAECLGLDDFVRPEAEWSSRDKSSFPFDFVRYGEFVDAVRSLAHNRRCLLHPYNWETGRVEGLPKVVPGDGIALVEGVSTLHPDLAPLYDLRIWIESDAETTLPHRCKEVLDRGLTNGSSCSYPASNSTSRPILRLGLIWLRAAGGPIEVSRGENYGRQVHPEIRILHQPSEL